MRHIDAVDFDDAGIRVFQTGEGVQQGGLPQPDGPSSTVKSPGFDRQIDILEDPQRPNDLEIRKP